MDVGRVRWRVRVPGGEAMLRFEPWAQRTPKGAKSRNEQATKNAPYKQGAFFVVASEGLHSRPVMPFIYRDLMKAYLLLTSLLTRLI